MYLLYGPVLNRWKDTPVDPTGLLLRCFASVIYHADWLRQECNDKPGHPFSSIPLLHKPDLLKELQELVNLDPVGDVVQRTGISPHTQMAVTCHNILIYTNKMLNKVKEIASSV